MAGYVDEAIQQWDSTAVHRARVTARRLEAALELLGPAAPPQAVKRMSKAISRIRRRLGRHRDLDVLRARLQADLQDTSHASSAARWLDNHLASRQDTVRQKLSPKALAKFHRRMSASKSVSQALARRQSTLAARMCAGALDRLTDFAATANQHLANRNPTPDTGQDRIDLHELRKSGKRLRYTLELAQHAGVSLPPETLKHFKHMQDDLGHWHDDCVFIDTVTALLTSADLASRDGHLAADLLDRCAAAARHAAACLDAFTGHWAVHGADIENSLRTILAPAASAEATADPAAEPTAPSADPDPAETAQTPPSAEASPADQPTT
jgi:CHAD domain-containing protein